MSNNNPYYVINGVSYPRVTDIISKVLNKEGLNQWRENVGKSIADETVEQARDIGSVTHDYINRILKGFSFTTDEKTMFEWAQLAPEIRNTLQSWESFRQTVEPTIKETEMRLVSKKYGYAGTTDAIAIVDKQLTVLDWKTANALWVEVEFQLAAYAMAYYEMTGKMPTQARAIRLDKGRDFWTTKDQVILTDIPKAFSAFLGLFEVYKYLEGKR